MPKKINKNKVYAENARAYIQARRNELGGAKPFFKLVYGRDPVLNEAQTLTNQINRGNYSAEFVGLLVDKLSLDEISLGEFYKGSKL